MSGSILTKELSTEFRRSVTAGLPSFLAKQRWFGGKARQIQSVEIADIISFENFLAGAVILVVRVSYGDGAEETYSLPLVCGEPGSRTSSREVTHIEVNDTSTRDAVLLVDALPNEQFSTVLLHAVEQSREFAGEKGVLRAYQTEAFADLSGRAKPARSDRLDATQNRNSSALQPKVYIGEQSNTSVIYGDRLILKFFRRIEQGINPDLEIGKFLTEKAHYKHTPQVAGWLEYRADDKTSTLAILQAFVPNEGDAWRHTLKSVSSFYEVAANGSEEAAGKPPIPNSDQASARMPEFASAALTPFLEQVTLLARRTAELHVALDSEREDPIFAPEPFTTEFQRNLERTAVQLTSGVFGLLRDKLSSLPPQLQDAATRIGARENEITRRFQSLLSEPIHAMRVRIHGDYHLGQVLYTGSDFVIIDFEGEPARPLAERRAKQSPLQDVAGMVRSLHYAAYAPLLGVGTQTDTAHNDAATMKLWAEEWYSRASAVFLSEYFAASREASFLPRDSGEQNRLLEMYLLEKGVYELGYELNNRPAWVGIPLEGISAILGSQSAARKWLAL